MRKFLVGVVVCFQLLGASDAVDFTLPSLQSEKSVSMHDYSDSVVLLNLWASWCKACKKEMPIVNEIAMTYKGKGLSVIAVNIDNKPTKAKKFLDKLDSKLGNNIDIIFAFDGKKSLPKAYDAKAIPLTLLIKDAKVIKRYLGSFHEGNKKELISDIEAALK